MCIYSILIYEQIRHLLKQLAVMQMEI